MERGHRKQLRPVIEDGAATMDEIVGEHKDSNR